MITLMKFLNIYSSQKYLNRFLTTQKLYVHWNLLLCPGSVIFKQICIEILEKKSLQIIKLFKSLKKKSETKRMT